MMINDRDISSTEKLLKVIRATEGKQSAPRSGDFAASGFFSKLRKRSLHFAPRECIGVECGRDRLNVVRTVRYKTGWQVVYAASETVPPGMGIDHSGFPDFLKRQIEKSGGGSKNTDIRACLPASGADIWSVRVPRIRKGLSNAVYWTARKEKSFDASGTIFDYRITGETTRGGIRQLVAEVVLAPAEEVSRYKKIFSGAGFPVKGLTLPALAMENLFSAGVVVPGEDPYAVLHIGEESSWIDIHGGAGVLFSRVIRTGRDSILDSLIMEYGRAPADANEPILIREPGSGPESDGAPGPEGPDEEKMSLSRDDALRMLKDSGGEKLFGMVEPALERLARQLERTIDHSVNVLGNPAPAKLYVCGGITFLPGITGFFGGQLDLPAERMDFLDPSFSHMSPDVFIPDAEDRLSLVTAAGLAVPGPWKINLCHTAFDRDREKTATQTTSAVAAGCALLFVLTTGYWWYALHEREEAREKVSRMEARLNEFAPQLTADMIEEMAGGRRRAFSSLEDSSRKLQAVSVLSEINRITPGSIRMLSVTMDLGEPPAGGEQNAGGTLVVEGFVRNDPSGFETRLTDYIRQLRRSVLVRDVAIRRAETDASIAAQEGLVYRFVLHIELEAV